VPFLFLILLLHPTSGTASVITLSDRPDFDAYGRIAYNSNFNDFGRGFGAPNGGFGLTRGDVTYDRQEPLTWGPDTPFTSTLDTLIGSLNFLLLHGTIAADRHYSMFGFDVGVARPGGVSIAITTNRATYLYRNLSLADSAAGHLEFRGFVTTGDEFFTGFAIGPCLFFSEPGGSGCSQDPSMARPVAGVTNVTVGSAAAVPEPASLSLLGAGFTGFLAWHSRISSDARRSRRARSNRAVPRVTS